MLIGKIVSILDLGVGIGFLIILVVKFVDNIVFVLDLDVKMLELIELKVKEVGLVNVEMLEVSMDDILFEVNFVDVVFVLFVLYEVDLFVDVLCEVSRVVKIGGYFVSLEFDMKGIDLKGLLMEI